MKKNITTLCLFITIFINCSAENYYTSLHKAAEGTFNIDSIIPSIQTFWIHPNGTCTLKSKYISENIVLKEIPTTIKDNSRKEVLFSQDEKGCFLLFDFTHKTRTNIIVFNLQGKQVSKQISN